VGAQKARHDARLDRERQIVHRFRRSVNLGQSPQLDHEDQSTMKNRTVGTFGRQQRKPLRAFIVGASIECMFDTTGG
ncbi:MAG: hypothetical protein K0Q61_3431, partial [Rhodococcus erythropolis]|nr:hypothetical protein [Rhodococcus erythropolis]